mgnify:CR=1 FL=1
MKVEADRSPTDAERADSRGRGREHDDAPGSRPRSSSDRPSVDERGPTDQDPALGGDRTFDQDVTEILDSLWTIAVLRWQRARLGAKEGAFTALLTAWSALVLAAASAVAAVLFLLRLAGRGSPLPGDRTWVGRLGAGTLVLCAGGALLLAARRRMRARFVRDLNERRSPTSPS